jgi:hypothetical protein
VTVRPSDDDDLRPFERFVEARQAIALRELDLGSSCFALYELEELAEAQIGYAIGAEDDDLTGDAPGQWRPHWLVVGEEELSQETLLVDLASDDLPVLVAAESELGWEPVLVAADFESFAPLLTELRRASEEGEDAAALLEIARARIPTGALRFWESWL